MDQQLLDAELEGCTKTSVRLQEDEDPMDFVILDKVDDLGTVRSIVAVAPGIPDSRRIDQVYLRPIGVENMQLWILRHRHAHVLRVFIIVTWTHSHGRLCIVLVEQHKLHRHRPLYLANLLSGLWEVVKSQVVDDPIDEGGLSDTWLT